MATHSKGKARRRPISQLAKGRKEGRIRKWQRRPPPPPCHTKGIVALSLTLSNPSHFSPKSTPAAWRSWIYFPISCLILQRLRLSTGLIKTLPIKGCVGRKPQCWKMQAQPFSLKCTQPPSNGGCCPQFPTAVAAYFDHAWLGFNFFGCFLNGNRFNSQSRRITHTSCRQGQPGWFCLENASRRLLHKL